MSRCFPFPPPGYEKRTTSERVDLLEKEKHKEKKHKKEKRDKERKEGKQKRDKDRSKDKHKEKKDRKEKRRDKKKDKDKDKDKSRTSEERNRKQTENHHEERFGESNWIAKESKDFKFMEELGRRIREEKGAANQLVENFGVVERSLEGFSAAPAMEKKSVTINKMVPNSISTHLERSLDELWAGPAAEREKITANKMVPSSVSTAQRRNDEVRQQISNASISAQKKSEGLGSETAVTITTGQRRNGGAGQSAHIPTGSTQRKPWSPTAAGTERGMHNKIITNPGGAVQRTNDGIGQPAERFSSSIQRKIEDIRPTNAMEKEKENGNRMLLPMEHGRNDAMAQYVEKNAGRAIQGKETGKERETDEGRRENDSNRHQDEKKKRKDKHKLKKKKKEEKIKEKSEDKHKEHNELRDNPRSNQTNGLNIKTVAHHNDDGKNSGSDANVKKRKDFETNGLLHDLQCNTEHDMRPTKFPRMTPSNLPVENGRTLLPYHVAAPCSSVKPDAIFNVKAEKLLDNKEKKTNGIPEAQRPPAELRLPVSAVASGNGEVSMRPPHPDSKYLTQVYSVPKMEEWPEPDDQEWLFIRGQLRPKPESKLEPDGIPQVWDEALHVESADVIALPYVIPF
ncbi:uncharacterized protein [Typha latifolia]|uniref:uncharacterized protein isoform X1 n=1 Tax=Typha latifolia TaxID=4733 RepID=UPI003C2F7B27